MEITLSKNSEVDSILNVIELAKVIMINNGNTTQWINGYPSKEIILNDIKNNQGYTISKNNEIIGYFCFLVGDDPEPSYKDIKEGKWLNNNTYGVVHRLASNGKQKGIADACFEFCFSKTSNIKVDTHEKNLPMQNYFRKKGFKYCGIINVSDGSPRMAFQKSI